MSNFFRDMEQVCVDSLSAHKLMPEERDIALKALKTLRLIKTLEKIYGKVIHESMCMLASNQDHDISISLAPKTNVIFTVNIRNASEEADFVRNFRLDAEAHDDRN